MNVLWEAIVQSTQTQSLCLHARVSFCQGVRMWISVKARAPAYERDQRKSTAAQREETTQPIFLENTRSVKLFSFLGRSFKSNLNDLFCVKLKMQVGYV